MPAPDTVRMAVRRTSLGLIGVAIGALGVRLVLLGDDEGDLQRDLAARLGGDPSASAASDDPDVQAVVDAVEGTGPTPSLDLRGTAFQLDVWHALMRIPEGTTVSYQELAAAAGHARAVRAVGTACGANPVSVLVPCHRVVRADGSLGGYGWGPEKKTTLLRREGAAASG